MSRFIVRVCKLDNGVLRFNSYYRGSASPASHDFQCEDAYFDAPTVEHAVMEAHQKRMDTLGFSPTTQVQMHQDLTTTYAVAIREAGDQARQWEFYTVKSKVDIVFEIPETSRNFLHSIDENEIGLQIQKRHSR